jgi:mRNA-degrading endonuclease toxin of MazEF toxin-antitoxin module
MAKHDAWNEVKKELDNLDNKVFFKEREIFWMSIGENIGFEQNGKGEIFSRPVLIVKKFSKNIFYGIPLSSKIKEGSFFYTFTFQSKQSNALLVQGRLFDSKRLENKMGMIDKDEFKRLKIKLRELLNV